jgi:hypothetical protein
LLVTTILQRLWKTNENLSQKKVSTEQAEDAVTKEAVFAPIQKEALTFGLVFGEMLQATRGILPHFINLRRKITAHP